jgi:uncharacterized membrane protein
MMARVERQIEVDRTPEEVFELLIDLDRLPEWATMVLENHDTPQKPLRAGQKFGQTIRIAGRNLTTQWEVSELEAGRRVAYRATGPAGASLEMHQRIAPRDGGSRVELEIDYDLPGGALGDAVDRIYVERRNEREAEHSLSNLKELLESDKKE